MRPLLIFILILSGLSAQAQLVLENVESAIQHAQQHNPLLLSSQQTVAAAEAAKHMQRAVLLPQLKAVSSLDYHYSLPVQLIPADFLGGEPGTYQAVSFGQPYALNLGLEASMPLINANLWLGTRLAAADARAAALQQEQNQLSTAESVAKAYYLSLLSQEALRLARNTKAANDSLLKQTHHKLQNGVMEPLEANRIRNLQLESARNLEENKTVYANNISRLKVLLGLTPEDELVLTEQFGQEQDVALPKTAYSYAALPEYRLGEAKVHQRKLSWHKERSKFLPELSAYARYTRQAQRAEFKFAESGLPWFDIGTVGVRLDWPLFTGLYRLSSTRQSHLLYKAASLEMEHTANRLQQEQLELQANYQQSRQSLQYAQEAYQLGDQNYQLAKLKYDAGVLPFDGLINVYHEKLRAQNALLKVLSEYLFYSALITTRNSY